MDLYNNNCVRIQFRSFSPAGQLVQGEGILIDLTREGCRVKSDVRVQPGAQLELRMYLLDHDVLIAVELSAVRWANGGEFGLEFVRMRSEAQEQIHRVVNGHETGALQ